MFGEVQFFLAHCQSHPQPPCLHINPKNIVRIQSIANICHCPNETTVLRVGEKF